MIPVIDRVSFAVDAGEFLCRLGPNGCGKTTPLRMLSARPARVRELTRNDGRVERARLVDDLDTMIMEEVERQQGATGPRA